MMKKTGICLLVLCSAAAVQAGVQANLRAGGKLYKEGKYGQALSRYVQAAQAEPENPRVLFNAADAYYQLKDYANAQNAFRRAAKLGDANTRQDALFNMGNAYYRAGDKQNAIRSYMLAIVNNPQDKEAVHNLQLILQEPPNQNNQNQQNDQSSDDSKNQDKQDNQDGKGQSPQDQAQNQTQPSDQDMRQEDAQRVMQMAKENEYKRPASAGNEEGASFVEKDW